jgi:MFS family permease
VSTGVGYLGGGYYSDKIGRNNRSRSLRAIAAALLLGWVFVFPLYLLANPYLVIALFFLPSALSNCYLPTTFAQVQSLVDIRMRSVASAILLFVINIIGLGLGPQVAGILSDYLSVTQGSESLRYSLLIIGAITGPWTAWHFYMAGRYIDNDLARVNEP